MTIHKRSGYEISATGPLQASERERGGENVRMILKRLYLDNVNRKILYVINK